MARKTKDAAEATRTSILKAALDLFAFKGVAGTTLSEVAQRAGVTRGAVYWHFDNKHHLLHCLHEEAVLPFDGIAQQGEGQDEPDPLGKLQDLYLAILKDVAESATARQFFKIWLDRGQLGSADRNESYAEMNERRQRWIRKIEDILQNAADKGHLSPNFDARLGAMALFTFLDGLVMMLLLDTREGKLKQDMVRMIDALFIVLRDASHPVFTLSPRKCQATAEA